MFSLETRLRWMEWNAALSIVQEGIDNVGIFGNNPQKENDLIIEAHNVVLNSISDADSVNQIEEMTGRNLREQLTVEEILELDKERTWRSRGISPN